MIEILKKIQKDLSKYLSSIAQKFLHEDYIATGVSIGKTRIFWTDYYVAYKFDRHLLVIGSSGSGKSSYIVIPTLYSWDDSIFAIDIKKELSNEYEKIYTCNKNARKFIRFDPMEDNGYKYDAFGIIKEFGNEYLVQLMKELAFSIIPDTQNAEKFWYESERSLLTGALIYYYELGASFSEAIAGIQATQIKDLINKIVNSQNIEDYNIFFCIPEDKISIWGNVISLMMNQFFRILERRPEKHTINGAENKQILMLLDEFPRIGKIDILNALSTLRSKKVTIAIMVQSLAQIDLIYGEKERQVICDNCVNKIFIDAHDPTTQQYMSDVVGEYEVDYIKNYSDISQNIGKQYVPIIRPHEFRTLKELIVVTPSDTFAVKPYPYYKKHRI